MKWVQKKYPSLKDTEFADVRPARSPMGFVDWS